MTKWSAVGGGGGGINSLQEKKDTLNTTYKADDRFFPTRKILGRNFIIKREINNYYFQLKLENLGSTKYSLKMSNM